MKKLVDVFAAGFRFLLEKNASLQLRDCDPHALADLPARGSSQLREWHDYR